MKKKVDECPQCGYETFEETPPMNEPTPKWEVKRIPKERIRNLHPLLADEVLTIMDSPETIVCFFPNVELVWRQEEDSARIVKAVNHFPALVEALKGLLDCDLRHNLKGGYQFQIEQAEQALKDAGIT